MDTQEKFMFSESMQFGRCSSISKEKGKTMGNLKNRLSGAWEIFLAFVTLPFAIPGIILEERRAAKARALDAGYDSVKEYDEAINRFQFEVMNEFMKKMANKDADKKEVL